MKKGYKFDVTVIEVEGGFAIQIENRAGRRWISNGVHGCPGNAAEDAMIIEECIINETLCPAGWTQTQGPTADEDKRRAYLDSIG